MTAPAKRKHLPVVQPDRVYEENYATRKQIAEGAEAYGKHTIYDKLGLEPPRSIYCRRDGGSWSPPSPDCDERIFKQSVVVTTPGGVTYETHAVTVPEGRFAEYAVCHFPRRFDVWTAVLSMDGYKPRTPEQLKAAAEQRRAKALAAADAEAAAELEKRRAAAFVQPSLFGDEP